MERYNKQSVLFGLANILCLDLASLAQRRFVPQASERLAQQRAIQASMHFTSGTKLLDGIESELFAETQDSSSNPIRLEKQIGTFCFELSSRLNALKNAAPKKKLTTKEAAKWLEGPIMLLQLLPTDLRKIFLEQVLEPLKSLLQKNDDHDLADATKYLLNKEALMLLPTGTRLVPSYLKVPPRTIYCVQFRKNPAFDKLEKELVCDTLEKHLPADAANVDLPAQFNTNINMLGSMAVDDQAYQHAFNKDEEGLVNADFSHRVSTALESLHLQSLDLQHLQALCDIAMLAEIACQLCPRLSSGAQVPDLTVKPHLKEERGDNRPAISTRLPPTMRPHLTLKRSEDSRQSVMLTYNQVLPIRLRHAPSNSLLLPHPNKAAPSSALNITLTLKLDLDAPDLMAAVDVIEPSSATFSFDSGVPTVKALPKTKPD